MQDICVTCRRATAYGRPRRAVKAWKSVAPIKCKSFVWLAHKHRLSTNARRHRHQLATLAICPLCPEVEDVDHLLVGCCKAREVWDSFSYSDGARGIDDLLDSRFRSSAEATVATAIAWNVWKRRNGKIFNEIDETLMIIRQRCIDDVRLWTNRCTKAAPRMYLLNWCHIFDPP
jgi:hypothetical protein